MVPLLVRAPGNQYDHVPGLACSQGNDSGVGFGALVSHFAYFDLDFAAPLLPYQPASLLRFSMPWVSPHLTSLGH